MGYKTLIVTSETEQKTYVRGEFTGKYHGVLNQANSYSKFENYDIHIYEGEINRFKNEKEHPELINETIYNSIVSETQLTQSIFKNVVVNIDETIRGYDSFTLAIKDPKLESVQIFDVEKNGNQTFGTLTCFVSGYLLKTSLQTREMQVETCDHCGEFLEECPCNTTTSEVTIVEEPPLIIENEESFWARNFSRWTDRSESWNWGFLSDSSFSCLGILGIFLGLLFLISFGLPGLLIGAFILLLYAIISQLAHYFPSFSLRLRRLFYILVGLLSFGLFFNYFTKGDSVNTVSIDNQKNKVPSKENTDEAKNYPNTNVINSDGQDQEIDRSVNQNTILESDDTPFVSQENSEFINSDSNDLSETDSQRRQILKSDLSEKPVNTIYADIDTSKNQNSTLATGIINNNNQAISRSTNTESIQLPARNSQILTDKSNSSIEENIQSEDGEIETFSQIAAEPENDDPNKTTQISNNANKEISGARIKQKRAAEIMTGIIFEEGEVFICKGDFSKSYHFDPDCLGLSNCSTRIYQISIPVAERERRTLCKLEE